MQKLHVQYIPRNMHTVLLCLSHIPRLGDRMQLNSGVCRWMEQHKSLSFPATPCLLPGLLSNRREYTGILFQRIFVSILYLDTTVDFTHVVSGASLYWEQVSPRGNIYVLSRGYFPDTSRGVLLQIRSETMSKRSVNHNLQKSAKNSKDIYYRIGVLALIWSTSVLNFEMIDRTLYNP